MVTRWKLAIGSLYEYEFPRNPNRYGGDSGWVYEPRMSEMEIIGANTPNIQIDGFHGARRTLTFSAITGTMFRKLRDFYLRKEIIYNCRDHLYPTSQSFNCFVVAMSAVFRPTTGNFPGSGEDTYDVEMTLIKM
jgi:hypothetical protein